MNYTTSKLSTQTASGFKKLITVVSVSLATLFVVIPTNAEDFWVGLPAHGTIFPVAGRDGNGRSRPNDASLTATDR